MTLQILAITTYINENENKWNKYSLQFINSIEMLELTFPKWDNITSTKIFAQNMSESYQSVIILKMHIKSN